MNDCPTIDRPKYQVVPLANALGWHWAGYHISEKMDGVWHELHIGQSIIVGELMKDGSFYAFDLPIFEGEDIRRRPTFERLALLSGFNLRRPATPAAGETAAEFLHRVLEAGGEGIVAKALKCPYGAQTYKVKRAETFDCLVTEIHATKQSLRLSMNGVDCGWCACLGKDFEKVTAGSVVEVKAMKRHGSGKFREPRFVRCRPDKSSA